MPIPDSRPARVKRSRRCSIKSFIPKRLLVDNQSFSRLEHGTLAKEAHPKRWL